MIFHAHIPLMTGGFVGVDIFFVLSGFLITTLLVSEFDKHGSISLKNFYARRMLRLGPALIAMLTAFCATSFFFLSKEKAHSNYIDSLISLSYFTNWVRAFSWREPDFLAHTWSLSIEEQFYIAWPLILRLLLKTIKNRWYVMAVAFIIAIFSWITRLYLLVNGATPERMFNGLDTRADGLMIGCIVGIIYASGLITEETIRGINTKFLRLISPISAAGLVLFAVFGNWQETYMYKYGFVVIEMLSAILLIDILVVENSILKKILRVKLLVWIGSVSYGLYLWHGIVYGAFFAVGLDKIIVLIFGTLTTFCIAALSYYILEKPLLQLKKRFVNIV